METANTSARQCDDPFFWLPDDSEWNACIGQQGDEENYVDGYIEAAIELASAVIDKRLYGKRDTLVMPILYNARHALELSLKFAIKVLLGVGVVTDAHPINHDIMSHWKLLQVSKLGDEALRECVIALEPYVASLCGIDDDGQELRYSESRDGQKSLADHSLANIRVIRTSLDGLSEVMTRLKDRVLELVNERAAGSYTADCSRRDLLEIARMLPKKSDWREPGFSEAKVNIMKRFSLTGRKFSKAVNVIEGNREMGCLIGLKTDLTYLSDQNVLFATEQWARRHSVCQVGDGLGTDWLSRLNPEFIAEHQGVAVEVNNNILKLLTPDEIADLETIYYIGRDHVFCEQYNLCLDSTRKAHCSAGALAIKINHLMEKTNFQEAVACGVSKLGRPDLADKMLELRPSVVAA